MSRLLTILVFVGALLDGRHVKKVRPTAKPVATLSPTALSFAQQTVGTSSDPLSVTLSNTGNASLSISNIAITGTNAVDFGRSTTCGTSLAPGASCAIKVTFTPLASGARAASLVVTDNSSAGSSQTASLSGTGVDPTPPPPTSSQFYVAPIGSDSNPGTLESPFATLGKCQTAMRGGTVKTCIIRGGTYSNLRKVVIASGFPTQVALFLTSQDSGTTWQYDPSDGYNTAILDGGNTTTGSTSMCQNTAYLDYGIYIEGASNVTVNGLTFQNFTFGGVALHGGSDYFGNWFPTGGLGSGTADRNLIENNIMQGIHNGIPTTSGVCTSPAWPPDVSHDNDSGGGIAAMGKVTNLTVTHNAVRNTQGEGMDFQMFSITDNMSGLSITNNFVDNANTANNDSGCMHIYNYAGGSSQGTMTGVIVNNNYLHDCGGSNSSSPYGSARGLYADDGASNITATGNVVSGHMAVCFNYHGGNNNLYYGNICDLGDGALGTQKIVQYQDSAFCTGSGCMANNIWRDNVVISKASISMGGYNTFINGSTPLNAQNDLTHAYGTGAVTDGASVSTADPQLSGWTYTITSGSPAFNSPVSFPKQPAGWGASGFWGPVGYVLPHAGTLPSCGF